MQILTDSSPTKDKRVEPSENKAPHRRSYWVEKTRKALGTNQNGDEFRFGHINGITADWSVKKIKRRHKECKQADIPYAPLWWSKRKS